jgi:hypothetical protein
MGFFIARVFKPPFDSFDKLKEGKLKTGSR